MVPFDVHELGSTAGNWYWDGSTCEPQLGCGAGDTVPLEMTPPTTQVPSSDVNEVLLLLVNALAQVELTKTPELFTSVASVPLRVNGSFGQPADLQPGISATSALPLYQFDNTGSLAWAIAWTSLFNC